MHFIDEIVSSFKKEYTSVFLLMQNLNIKKDAVHLKIQKTSKSSIGSEHDSLFNIKVSILLNVIYLFLERNKFFI